MKNIASFAAYNVFDLDSSEIVLSKEMVEGNTFRFCVAVKSVRFGTQYREVSPGCIAYYCADDFEGATARAIENNHELYWLNNCGASITSHKRAKEMWVLLNPGQVVIMNGVKLEVFHKRAEFYGLRAV